MLLAKMDANPRSDDIFAVFAASPALFSLAISRSRARARARVFLVGF
jgi:hypothetical protein